MSRLKTARTHRTGSIGSRPFIFCTGIENSYPIITDHKGRDMRRDGLELSGHYTHWRHDLRLVKDLGLRYLRYGPPYYICHKGPDEYDWSFPDKTFALLRKLRIEPIVDLCHFGLPDWMGGSFQNPQFPAYFAQYASAFAQRYPWVRLFTPVNEIFVCAQFSGLNGWWNERLKSDQAFIKALKHLCQANLLAEQAILKIRRDAQFIQSESSTYYHPAVPAAGDKADFHNQCRFLALDLCYGREVNGTIYEYLMDNGLSRQDYRWFMERSPSLRQHCVMGSDYYSSNEKKVMDSSGTLSPSGEVLGYYEIAKQYFDRYRLPIFHTETNRKNDADAARWLHKEWFNVLRLKADGIPILGFTWYSLLDQTDWDVELREDNERINPMGLYDLQRKIRPVGAAYRDLIAAWTPHLPLDELSRDLSPLSAAPRRGKAKGGVNGQAGSADGHPARIPRVAPIVRPVHPVMEHPPKPRNRKVAKGD